MFPSIPEVDAEILRMKEEKKVAIKKVTDTVQEQIDAVRHEYDKKLQRLRTLKRCIM